MSEIEGWKERKKENKQIKCVQGNHKRKENSG